MPESTGEGTAFLYPFIEGDERDAGSLLVDLGRSAVAKAETSAELRAATLARTTEVMAAAADAMAEAFDRGGRLFTFGNGGSSTDAASLAALFARPPTGRALPARCLVDDTAVLTALGNDVGFELVFARQLIAHAAPGDVAIGFSTSGSSANVLTAFAPGPRPAPRHHRAGRLRRRARWAARPTCSTASSCSPTACTGSRRPRPPWASPCGRRCSSASAEAGRRRLMADVGDREARVLDRIEAHRRRAPRLTDDLVTMAHGAGGKASAALVDAVFLEAFAAGERMPLADAATLSLPGGERLAFTTDSFVVQPLRFPGGSIGHLAVHGTVNDLAVLGAQPRWLSAAFVIEEGFPVAELRAVVADMAEAATAAGVTIVTGDTKVVGRGAADGLYVTTAGVGVLPPGRTARSGARPSRRRRVGVGHDRRPRHGRHAGPGRPGARRRHPVRHRGGERAGRGPVRRPRRRRGGCGTRPGEGWAPSATSWHATPTSP